MGSLLKRVFRRENAVLLLLLAGAFFSTIGIPQRYGVTENQLILGLLGLFAIDSFIERLGLLERIEQSLDTLRSHITPRLSPDQFLLPRDRLPQLEMLLDQGSEILLASKSLSNMLASHARQISAAAKRGKRFRFLIHDPTDTALLEMVARTSYTNKSVGKVQIITTDALEQLVSMAASAPGNIEIKTTSAPLANGFTIVDGDRSSGFMIIEFFAYKLSLAERRHMRITRSNDFATFEFYYHQFERIWEDATKVVIGDSPEKSSSG